MTELFLACCDLPEGEQAAFLKERCGEDTALRERVEELLGFESANPEFLQASAGRDLEVELSAATFEIAGFRMLSKLGEGGMATVFEAEQERPQRPVALKILRCLASPEVTRRFEFESELLGRLHHPGIAQVYEAGVAEIGAGRQPWFAMELVRGKSLTAHVRAVGASNRERLALLATVCDAVEHAHQRGVVHRDLKPANILVDEAGRPKVLDFGVARVTDADLSVTTLRTGVGQVIGTLQYMSPEQAAGDQAAVETRSDVYALGVIAYELLTDELPYDLTELSIAEAVRSIQETDPRPPSELRRALRGDAQTIVMKALEKDRTRRYDSAASLADDIRRYLRNEPIEARPATRSYKLRLFATRNQALVGALVAIGATLIVATIVSLRQAARAEQQRDLAVRRLADVRALANTLLFEFHDKLEPLPGSTEVRRDLVRTAMEYLDLMQQESDDDPALQAELAEAYARIGDIQGYPRQANLGDTTAALESYRRSDEIRERLLGTSDATTEHTLARADLARRFGVVQNAIGEHAAALASFDRSIEAAQGVLVREPENLEARHALHEGFALLGSAQAYVGRVDEALETYLHALALAEGLVEAYPDDLVFKRSVSKSCNEVAMMLERAGRGDEAVQYVELSLSIREDLAERYPDDYRRHRDLALSHHRAGGLAIDRGDFEQALVHAELALGRLRAIAEADPGDNRARFDLSVAYDERGRAFTGLERHEQGIADRLRVCDLREGLMHDNPENNFHAAAYAGSLEGLARAHRDAGHPEPAAELYREGIEQAELNLIEHPDDGYAPSTLIVCGSELGQLLMRQAEDAQGERARELFSEAELHLGRSLELLDEMHARDARPNHGQVEHEGLVAALEACAGALAP